MSRRSILAVGAFLALNLGVARAQDNVEPVAAPVAVDASETAPQKLEDAQAAIRHDDAHAGSVEEAHAAEAVEKPLGEDYSYDTSPALGTPPSLPSALPPARVAAPAPVPAVPAAAAVPQPIPAMAPPPAVAALPAPQGAVPLAVPADAPKDVVEVAADEYRRKLSGCIKTASTPSCDKRELTKLDRDYLRYDRGEKSLSRDELDEVSEARMMQFDGASKVMMRKVEPAKAPEKVASRKVRRPEAVAKVEPTVPAAVPDAAPKAQASAEIKPVR